MRRLHPKAHLLNIQLANGHTTSSTSTITTTATATTTTTTTTTVAAEPASYFVRANKSDFPPLRLPSRHESTRDQLQKQRLSDQQDTTQLVSATIPGIKISAAFFASLRTNLRLHASPPLPSPISTPNSIRGSTSSLPPPSPLSVPIMEHETVADVPVQEDQLAGVPELSSYLATDDEERTDALNLVADSVAQQRQTANSALIFHPLHLAVAVALFAVIVRTMLNRGWDLIASGLTCLGLLMAALASCRYMTQGYLYAAEKVNWEWAGDADVLITKFGDEVIGTLLIEWASGESRKKGKKAWRGLIKAWTVKLRYRGKGVGTALLEDAVKEAQKKGAEGLEFDPDHANSKRVLPTMYNAIFDRREHKSQEKLQSLLESSPVRGKRR